MGLKPHHAVDGRAIEKLIRAHRFSFAHEAELQDGIELMLQEEGIAFAREFIIDSKSRIDFLVGAVGLEVKVGGSLAAVTRQLFRYAQVEVIKELVLVSSRQFHNQLPAEMNGKPLRAISLTMSAF